MKRTDPGGEPWRLIVHGAGDAAWNMAVDEALAEAYARREEPAPPTLRIYGWSPPALSLGRSQPVSGSVDACFLREEGIDLVRRPTGGGAVLHEHERTYSVTGRLRAAPFEGGVVDTYRRVARGLATAFRLLGLEVEDRSAGRSRRTRAGLPVGACFASASTHEITRGGLKLVGSAQWRTRGAFLQHGSIPIRADPARLARSIGAAEEIGGFIDLERALGTEIDARRLDEAIVAGFEESFRSRFDPGGLTASETDRAVVLRSWKYLSAAWTLYGKISRDG